MRVTGRASHTISEYLPVRKTDNFARIFVLGALVCIGPTRVSRVARATFSEDLTRVTY